MTVLNRVAEKWVAVKPIAIALAIGLIVGPFVSNYLGWQVTSRTARTQLSGGLVDQLASICEDRARADVKDPSKLDWDAKRALATKWVIMPGTAAVSSDVTNECARKLDV